MGRGIVVLGCPRSGTTLVRRLLDAHPDVVCPPETGLLSAAGRFLEEQAFPSGVRFGAAPGLAQLGVAREELLDRLRTFVVGFFEEHAARAGAKVWAEKSVSDAFFVEPIEELLGDTVQYVVVLRHGLDVAVSLQELVQRSGAFLAELFPYASRDPDVVSAMATAWCDVTTALLDLAERRRDVVVVRYESLAHDPDAVVRTLFEGLSLDTVPVRPGSAQAVGFGDWKTWSRGSVDASSVGRWRRAIPRAQQPAMVARVNPVLERAGYDAEPVPKPVGAEDAQRRLELALRLDADRAQRQVSSSQSDDSSTP